MQPASETAGEAARSSGPLSLQSSWEALVGNRLQLYGHRNWIVIADSAYPAQARQGIETIFSNDEPVDVVRRILAKIRSSSHVKPSIVIDRELEFISEEDAPGVSAYRQELAGILGSIDTEALPHEQIIAKLDEAAHLFRVLVIKTGMRIPYSTVFLRFECAYWDAEAEGRLRERMNAHSQNAPPIRAAFGGG